MSKSKFLSVLLSFANNLSERIDTIFARKTDLTAHTGDTDVHVTSEERSNWDDAFITMHEHPNKTVLDNTTASFTTEEQAKLSDIDTGAEVNQNAFTNIIVGNTTISANTKSDGFTLVAGDNVLVTPDETNKTIVIESIDWLNGLHRATAEDIDDVISGSYVSDGEEYPDIDAIINGTYVE